MTVAEAVPSFLALVLLSVVHVLTPRIVFLRGIPRSIWLSAAGGVSVGYVFVHLLPELSEGQASVQRMLGSRMGFVEHHEYLVALAGLVVFYGLDRMTKVARGQHREETGRDHAPAAAFWVHVVSFAAYNVVIGYLLLHGEREGALPVMLFAVAIGLHFLVTDYGFIEDYREELYCRAGRWVLVFSLTLGWLLGLTTQLSEGLVATITAFLAGGILINVFKEELPQERESRFWPFVIGVIGYAALLLSI